MNFYNAYLVRALLYRANLQGAYLEYADFTSAKNIETVDFTDAENIDKAIGLPQEIVVKYTNKKE